MLPNPSGTSQIHNPILKYWYFQLRDIRLLRVFGTFLCNSTAAFYKDNYPGHQPYECVTNKYSHICVIEYGDRSFCNGKFFDSQTRSGKQLRRPGSRPAIRRITSHIRTYGSGLLPDQFGCWISVMMRSQEPNYIGTYIHQLRPCYDIGNIGLLVVVYYLFPMWQEL